jgi:hypothetical protein
MATPPHMAPVTVGGVTVDPALLHMSIPDDEPVLDDVEVMEEEALAPLPTSSRCFDCCHWDCLRISSAV